MGRGSHLPETDFSIFYLCFTLPTYIPKEYVIFASYVMNSFHHAFLVSLHKQPMNFLRALF
jgi:hypothetical protein